MGQYRRKLKKGYRWYYQGQFLGKRYVSKAIYLTRQECKKAETEKLKELDEQARNPTKDVSLHEAFSHRLDYLELIRSQEYYEDNHRICKNILKKWGNINISEITRKMVSDLIFEEIRRCKKEKLANHRPNQILKVIKASINYAIKHFDLEIRNPCNHISKLPEDRKVKFIPTEEMIEEVIEKCNPAQKLLIKFAYETAARINECISLQYKDVHEKHVVLYTRKSENSSSVPRFVPRPDFIESGGTGKVFQEWEAYPRFLERKVKELKHPRWSWHSLRHRRASIWANSDMPLFQLQMLLGHSQISTTQRYLHSLGIVKL